MTAHNSSETIGLAMRREYQISACFVRLSKAFGDTPGARNAMMMLTSRDRHIPLFDKERPEDRYERVTQDEVTQALIPGDMIEYKFDPKQSAIRDSFGDFLIRLGHIEVYLEANLLSQEDASHVVVPWIRNFKRLSDSPKLKRNLCLYIAWQEMTSVQRLFSRFGMDLKENLSQARSELAAEIATTTSESTDLPEKD